MWAPTPSTLEDTGTVVRVSRGYYRDGAQINGKYTACEFVERAVGVSWSSGAMGVMVRVAVGVAVRVRVAIAVAVAV